MVQAWYRQQIVTATTTTNISQYNFLVLALRSEMTPSCHSEAGLADQVFSKGWYKARKYNWYVIRGIVGSPIATVEGVVDLITGVRDQREKEEDEGNTGGVDIRHCKGCLEVFERSWFWSWEGSLSAVEILRASNAFYNLSRVSNCLVQFGRSLG